MLRRALEVIVVYTADAFCHLLFFGLDVRTPFLDLVVSNLQMPPSYRQMVYDVWKEMRPQIVAGHIDFSKGVAMFLRELPQWARVEPAQTLFGALSIDEPQVVPPNA